jgi:predicted alpha/beta superfamily hydrolase
VLSDGVRVRRLLPLLVLALHPWVGCVDAGPGEVTVDGDGDDDGDDDVGVATVRVHYPLAGRSLALRTEGADVAWGTPDAAGDDTWTFTSAGVPADGVAVRVFLDESPSRGPAWRAVVGEDGLDVWPHFDDGPGRVEELFPAFASAHVAGTRDVRAYLPPGYDENPREEFPVVYMTDGQDLFDPARAFNGIAWGVDAALDAAADDGAIRPAIVIAIASTAARVDEFTPTRDDQIGAGGNADAWLAMFVDELKPAVDDALRTRPGPADTALVGSSLGGLLAAHAGTRSADVIGLVGSLSPAAWWGGGAIVPAVRALPAAPRPMRVYVDVGTAEESVEDVRALADAWSTVAAGAAPQVRFVEDPAGTFDATSWGRRLPGALAFLLGPAR